MSTKQQSKDSNTGSSCSVCSTAILPPSIAHFCSVCLRPAHEACGTDAVHDDTRSRSTAAATETNLSGSPAPTKIWKCKTCFVNSGDPNYLSEMRFAALMTQLTHLSTSVNSMNQQIANFTTMIHDNTVAIQECKSTAINLESNQLLLQNRLDQLEQKSLASSKHSDADDLYNEIIERQKRSQNLIVSGLNESDEDLEKMNEILALILPGAHVSPGKVLRLGQENGSGKARLMKATFHSAEIVTQVLKSGWSAKLRSTAYKNVKLRSDITPNQSQKLSELRAELAKRQANGESNLTIKYVKNTPTIVTKKRTRDEDESPVKDSGYKQRNTSNSTAANLGNNSQSN